MTLFLLLGLVLLLALSVPIAYAMLLISILYLLLMGDVPLIAVAQRVVAGTDHYLLLAIPFFFLTAELMGLGGMLDRLMRFATVVVGHIRGGLAQVNVLSSMLFAGISGSAVADAAGMGRLEIEMMHKGGYAKGFAAAITAASSTIGPVIPPSIPFIVYAGIASVSVGSLFLAGIVPGILMGVALMVLVDVIARRRGYPRERRATLRAVLAATWSSIPLLLLPVIIIGGIRTGVFTPTEAAIVAATYAFLLGWLFLRTLGWRMLYQALLKVGTDTARLTFIIASSSIFAWILAREGIPQAIADSFLAVSREPWIILILVNALLLALGMFLEPIVVLILLTPILYPLITLVGIDPVHFGVVMTINLMIGLLTPPVGTVMFIMMGVANLTMEQYVKETWPFIAVLVAVLLLVTYIPALSLFLPNLFSGVG
jgi:tripartite ATP-independent transporter DctM subunit